MISGIDPYRFRSAWQAPLLAFLLLFPALAGAQTSLDPWENWNRKIFVFNDTVDRYTLKPVARGYRAVTPEPVRTGVHNVFRNLLEIRTVVNQLLQGKPLLAASDTARFLVNTTVGVAGIFDVASHLGLSRHDEDFGQTLGYWGLPSGPYLVIPFLGAGSLRDSPAQLADTWFHPIGYIDHVPTRNVTIASDLVAVRTNLLDAEDMVFGDRYGFIRDAYLQRRAFLVSDGAVMDDFGTDDDGAF